MIGIVKQQTDAVSGVSGCASAPAHGDVSWRAKAGRAGKRGARFAAQLALVVAVYGAGCAIASVLPVRLPGNIVGLVLLVCVITTVIVFLATSYTVMLVSRLTAKRVDATGVARVADEEA